MNRANGTTAAPRPFDVNQVRREARRSPRRGAVTPDYPLDLERAHELLNEALATEILCVLRYRHHEVIAKGIDAPQVAAEFAEHADAEHRHMMQLAVRIDQLGGNPDFNPATVPTRSAAEYGKATTLPAMIKDDLIAERVVIEIYRHMTRWFGTDDPTTRRLVEAILAEEEEHANDLAALLAAVDPHADHPR
jgi:bacterioferritin